MTLQPVKDGTVAKAYAEWDKKIGERWPVTSFDAFLAGWRAKEKDLERIK